MQHNSIMLNMQKLFQIYTVLDTNYRQIRKFLHAGIYSARTYQQAIQAYFITTKTFNV